MTEYSARSAHHSSDSKVLAHRIGRWVHISGSVRGKETSTALDPAVARTFARGILALADEIDGGEATKARPAAPRMPKIGERIRILVDDAEYASVSEGDVFTVINVDTKSVTVDDGEHGHWYFWKTSSYEIVDETSDATAPTPQPSPFAAHVEEAKRLLADTDHTGADVVHLAEILAQQ